MRWVVNELLRFGLGFGLLGRRFASLWLGGLWFCWLGVGRLGLLPQRWSFAGGAGLETLGECVLQRQLILGEATVEQVIFFAAFAGEDGDLGGVIDWWTAFAARLVFIDDGLGQGFFDFRTGAIFGVVLGALVGGPDFDLGRVGDNAVIGVLGCIASCREASQCEQGQEGEEDGVTHGYLRERATIVNFSRQQFLFAGEDQLPKLLSSLHADKSLGALG